MVKTIKNKKTHIKIKKTGKNKKSKSQSRTLKKKSFRKKAGFLFKNKKQKQTDTLENTLIEMNKSSNVKFMEEIKKPPQKRNLNLLKIILENIKKNNGKLNAIFYNGTSKYQYPETIDTKDIVKVIEETEKAQSKQGSEVVETTTVEKAKKPEKLAPLPACWKQVFDKDFNRSYVRSDGLKADKNNRPSPDAECP